MGKNVIVSRDRQTGCHRRTLKRLVNHKTSLIRELRKVQGQLEETAGSEYLDLDSRRDVLNLRINDVEMEIDRLARDGEPIPEPNRAEVLPGQSSLFPDLEIPVRIFGEESND